MKSNVQFPNAAEANSRFSMQIKSASIHECENWLAFDKPNKDIINVSLIFLSRFVQFEAVTPLCEAERGRELLKEKMKVARYYTFKQ